MKLAKSIRSSFKLKRSKSGSGKTLSGTSNSNNGSKDRPESHEDHDTIATADDQSCNASFDNCSMALGPKGDTLDQALQLCQRGQVLDSEADLEGATESYREAVELLEKSQSGPLTTATLCDTYERVAYVLYKVEDYAQAKANFDKAKVLRQFHPMKDESKREEIEYLMEMVDMML